MATKGQQHVLQQRDQITYILRAGWPPKGQQRHVFQQRDQITYSLKLGDGHQGSAVCFAAKRPDHLHSEGRRWPPMGQQQVLWQRDQITYMLRV